MTYPVNMFGTPSRVAPKPKTPGGKAMKYLATHRLFLEKSLCSANERASEGTDVDGNRWGFFMDITITKNTVDADNRTITIPYSYKKGFMDKKSIRNFIFSA